MMVHYEASSASDAGLRGRDTVPTKHATRRRRRPSKPCGLLRAARTAPELHALPAHRRASAARHVMDRHAAPASPAEHVATAESAKTRVGPPGSPTRLSEALGAGASA